MWQPSRQNQPQDWIHGYKIIHKKCFRISDFIRAISEAPPYICKSIPQGSLDVNTFSIKILARIFWHCKYIFRRFVDFIGVFKIRMESQVIFKALLMSYGGTCSFSPTQKARLGWFLWSLIVSLAHSKRRPRSKGPFGFEIGSPFQRLQYSKTLATPTKTKSALWNKL